MNPSHREQGIGVYRLSVRFLEATQVVIGGALILVLFSLTARTLLRMVRDSAAPELDVRVVVSEDLFALVMVELVRMLLVDLREHHVAVDFMVEIGITRTLREVVLHGVADLGWQQIVALAAFLVALGLLLRFGDLRRRGSAPAGELSRVESTNGRRQAAIPVGSASAAE